MFGLEITKYTVYINVYIWFWPTLHILHKMEFAFTPSRTPRKVVSLGVRTTHTLNTMMAARVQSAKPELEMTFLCAG
jgi:hypothetical protein